MILYYALGGGLGHITRAQAVVHTLGHGEAVRLVTSSPRARDLVLAAQFERIEAPAELARDLAAHRRWLQPLLDGVRLLYVDCFPGGLAGELCNGKWAEGIELVYVARRLRWRIYAGRLRGAAPRYDRCYVLEKLEPEHEAFVAARVDALEFLELEDYPLPVAEQTRELFADGPFSLLVHSGPAEEIAELLDFADAVRQSEGDDSPLYLVAPELPGELPSGVHYRDIYPAQPLFAAAQQVFSACGFNIMRQMRPWRGKHRFMPFARVLDDQYARARLARAELDG